ncbi:MAG: phosphoribosylaminoimidazolesuccinocarboxamide synthase [Clostridiales bacterium]|jgi:phosphoribosylaminoimidazole-succinocarboxamide synthase|nr:phosphoribosylaminoimidazolesuccinocarboxamide synthase [Clostridiales bacterium]
MKLINSGKTKDVYLTDDGNYLFKFKDDVTGENGIFDPGANTVGLKMEGAGNAALRLTTYFFKVLKDRGIPTHFIDSDIGESTMKVKKAKLFGEGIEVICRYRAVGSFLRRYGKYAREGQALHGLVEITLKDDLRNDPLITKDALERLGILTTEEYEILKDLTLEICEIIREELADKGLELFDIKLEFGRVGDNNKIALIDEISGGNMRVYKDGSYVGPIQLTEIMLNE